MHVFPNLSVLFPVQQEPAHNGVELMNGLREVRPGEGFVPNFPLTWTIAVNGATQHDMYTYLKVSTLVSVTCLTLSLYNYSNDYFNYVLCMLII